MDHLKIGELNRLEGKINSTIRSSEHFERGYHQSYLEKGAVRCFQWLPEDLIHEIVKDEYDHFVMNADGSIVASKVLDKEKRTISDTVDIYWESDKKFLEWQKEFLKTRLHKEVLEDLRKLR